MIKEERLVVDIPTGYMRILDGIKKNTNIPKKGIVTRALRDYFYRHRDVLRPDKFEDFLIEYLEG